MYPRSIYKITHLPTGRIYVGSSHNPEQRWKAHLSALRNGKHPVEDMQEDFDELGKDYNFEIIGQIDNESEDHKEYDFMLELNSNIRGSGYNYKNRKCPTNDAKENKTLAPYFNPNQQRHINNFESELVKLCQKSSDIAMSTELSKIYSLCFQAQLITQTLLNIFYKTQAKENPTRDSPDGEK